MNHANETETAGQDQTQSSTASSPQSGSAASESDARCKEARRCLAEAASCISAAQAIIRKIGKLKTVKGHHRAAAQAVINAVIETGISAGKAINDFIKAP